MTIEVDSPALAQAKNDVSTAVDNIRSLINAARSDADGMREGWMGEAHDAFAMVADQWDLESNKVNALLDRIQEAIGTANTRAQNTESDSRSQLAGIQGEGPLSGIPGQRA
ncbi:WXG100 family type VII secretion target [Nocardia terpenica]|nr:WXG100 family type VII secretion target [Nocardia terpenica]